MTEIMTPDAHSELNWFENPPAGITPQDNKAHLEGTSIYNTNPYTAAQIDAVLSGSGNGQVILNQVVTSYNTNGAIAVGGKAALVGGTGLSMSLAAPVAYAFADMLLESITSGNLVIKTATGVTFDGTNNTATATVASSQLSVGYSSSTSWLIFKNSGFTFSST
jgi:hypothetical protein